MAAIFIMLLLQIMISRIHNSIDRIPIWTWHLFSACCAVFIFSVILLNRSPNLLRPISIALREGFGVILFASMAAIYASFRINGRIGELISFTAVLALFALGLAGIWASGGTQSILISGLIPISDASAYYIDAIRIIHGMEISDFSAMRPFFPGFLAGILYLSNMNLLLAVGIITAIAGIAAHLSAREIQSTHGPEAAAIFLGLVFLYFRHHSGTTMSETLGVSVGLFGFALLWRSISEHSQIMALTGLATLTLSLNIRPGAMFVLPAVLVFGGIFFRKDNRVPLKFIISGILLIAIVFMLNKLMITLLAGPGKTAFANFSWALFGLVSGGQSWNYIFTAHPEVLDSNSNVSIHSLIWDQFTSNPMLTLQGAVKYWRIFFSSTWYNAYSFTASNNFYISEFIRWLLYILSFIFGFQWAKNKNKDSHGLFIIFGGAGILASVPFVPPTDAYRVRLYAATIPFFAIIPALGLGAIVEFYRGKFESSLVTLKKQSPKMVFAPYIAALIIGIFLVPVWLKQAGEAPTWQDAPCPTGMESIISRFDAGTAINLHREKVIFIDWMPDFHQSVFRRNAHSLSDGNLTAKLKSINPPSTLFSALDFTSGNSMLLVINTDQLPSPGNFFLACGYWEDDPGLAQFGIFEAITVQKIP